MDTRRNFSTVTLSGYFWLITEMKLSGPPFVVSQNSAQFGALQRTEQPSVRTRPILCCDL